MGIFKKLFSRKKSDDEMEEQNYEPDFEQPRTEVPPWSKNYDDSPRRGQFQNEWPQPQQAQQSSGANEIILAKLDVINAKLDSLNQRLANLERYAAEEEKSSKPRW